MGLALRRTLALVAAIGLVLGLGLLGPPTAWAAAGDGRITDYGVSILINADGTIDVTESIEYYFTDQSHGIYRMIPDRYPYPPDDTFQRSVEISDIRVSSPNGVPTNLEVSQDGDYLSLRIGDPDRTFAGTGSYVISYTVSGAFNSFPDHEELYWNAIGTEWDVAIDKGRVVVQLDDSVDGSILAANCFDGVEGSSLPCANQKTRDRTYTASATGLGYGNGMTVVVGVTPDSVDVGAPILVERWSVQRAFSLNAGTVSGVVVILLLGGLWIWYLVYRRGRDRRFAGQVPGLAPVAGGPAGEELVPRDAPVAVQFSPPENVPPGLVGTLQDEQANVLDVTATIVDLAVRNYLRISQLERPGWFGSQDWQLEKVKDADSTLLRYERTLFNALFEGRDSVKLSDLKRHFADDLKQVQSQLYTEMVSRRWYRRSPESTRIGWYSLGFIVLAGTVGITYLLARYTHLGLLGLALVLVAGTMFLTSRAMPARTGEGSAVLSQVLGFKQYIATAEANQLKWEEAEKIFSRYLPFAVVFGLADHWAGVFQQLAAANGVAMPAVYWYHGPAGWSFDDFSSSIDSFSTTTAGSLSAAASSGGSGFGGGGFSGGGFGGGGGGGW